MKTLTTALLFASLLGTPTPGDALGAERHYRLADVGWLAGTWRGEAGPWSQEEIWTAPAGGLMLGLHRDVRSDGRSSFEYLRIQQVEGEVIYFASPGGRPATPFRLVELEGFRAVFENLEHDFPTRIVYERRGRELRAHALGPDGTGLSFAWSAAPLLAE